jgi:hypothetical protein
MSPLLGEVTGGLAEIVFEIRIRPGGKQQTHHFQLALGSCLHESRPGDKIRTFVRRTKKPLLVDGKFCEMVEVGFVGEKDF